MGGVSQSKEEGPNPRPFQLLSDSFDADKVRKTELDLSPVSLRLKDPVAFTLDHVFSLEECQALVRFAEREGFAKVPINYGGGKEVVDESGRKGLRVIADDKEFVAKLWDRISAHVPPSLKGAGVTGLNERLRILKYTSNNFFAPHTDGHYARRREDGRSEISVLTIQMYLNEDFGGGETTFLPPYPVGSGSDSESKSDQVPRVPIKPRTGMVLIFDQDLKHEGSTVTRGKKYTMRTDIMYLYKD